MIGRFKPRENFFNFFYVDFLYSYQQHSYNVGTGRSSTKKDTFGVDWLEVATSSWILEKYSGKIIDAACYCSSTSFILKLTVSIKRFPIVKLVVKYDMIFSDSLCDWTYDDVY